MGERERILVPQWGEILIRRLWLPGDGAAYQRFGAALAPDDLRLRFAVPTRWGPGTAQRLAPLDGAAFAAFDRGGEILGIGDVVAGEVALAIRSDFQRRGLGRALLERIREHAVERGMTELVGCVLAENRPMLALAQIAGFRAAGFEGSMVSLRLCLP